MAVQPQTPYIEYLANGTTKSFPLEFDCENQDHLIVLVDDLEPVVGTWSLSGGAVVFTVAPAVNKKITIQRNTPFERERDYQSYDNSFRPPAVNKDFDWIWFKLQELGVADWILGNRIDALKNYVDLKDDELRAYLMEEIRKQGVALDQLDEYYNYLMERLAQIAVDKGWDASFVVDGVESQKQINDKTTQFLDSINNLKALEPRKTGQIVEVLSYNDPLIGLSEFFGGGLFRYHSSGSTGNDVDVFLSDHGGVWKRIKRKDEYDITWGGAIANNTDESVLCQKVLDVAGEKSRIKIPGASFFVPAGLQMYHRQSIVGVGSQSSLLEGNGSNPVIKTNSSVSGTIRNLSLQDIGVDNFSRTPVGVAGAYGVQWWAANDSHIQRCEFKSRYKEALHVKYSYRGSINKNRITSSGNTFALALINNCNGIDASNNTVSGGSAGSGVRVGMSQTINLANTVVEVAAGVAMRIGGDDGEDGGICTGVDIRGLYAEQCKRVLEAGLKYECYDIQMTGFRINQKTTSVVQPYEEALHLGRVSGLTFFGGAAESNNTVKFIKLYNNGAGTGITPFLSGSTMKTKVLTGYVSPYFSFDANTADFQHRIFGSCEIALNSNDIIGSQKEYITSIIECKTSVAQQYVVLPSTFGGLIQSIDIIDASGALDGTLDIGSAASAVEILNLNLSGITHTLGFKNLAVESDGKFIRATGLLLRFTSASTTSVGKFRLKVRYRN